MLHVVSDDGDENFNFALFYIYPLSNSNYKLGNCGGQTRRLRNSSICSLAGIFIFITNVDGTYCMKIDDFSDVYDFFKPLSCT